MRHMLGASARDVQNVRHFSGIGGGLDEDEEEEEEDAYGAYRAAWAGDVDPAWLSVVVIDLPPLDPSVCVVDVDVEGDPWDLSFALTWDEEVAVGASGGKSPGKEAPVGRI